MLAALLLAACGGGSSSNSTSASTSSEPAPQGDRQAAREKIEAKLKELKEKQASATPKAQKDTGNGSGDKSANIDTPLQVSGGGSGQFRTKGGDNSIQEFGAEGDEAELQEAAEAVHGFLVAQANEDWSAACSYLAKSMIQQLEQFAAQSKQFKGGGCPPILKAFTRPLPSAARRETTVVDAGSLRREGEQAFLIYYGAEKTAYAIPMKPEGGEWKVAALAGTPLG